MWKLVQSANVTKPDAVDTVSSASVVYVRKDFQQVEVTEQGEDGEETTRQVWQWQELDVPASDWETYESVSDVLGQTESNTANIDYIAMMADIVLPEA